MLTRRALAVLSIAVVSGSDGDNGGALAIGIRIRQAHIWAAMGTSTQEDTPFAYDRP